jgi:hypothetical protein
MTNRVRVGVFLVAGFAVAVVLALVVSPYASTEPDGLERAAIEEGFGRTEQRHALQDAPTAGYAVRGVDDDRLSTGVAGLIGVLITFALAGGVLLVVRRRGRRPEPITR